jgi:hypothetical protein
VLANAHRYGDGARRLRIGRVGERFVCEISDHGPGLDDPLAGYVPPGSRHARRTGLWIARQMTQRLDMLSTERGPHDASLGLSSRLPRPARDLDLPLREDLLATYSAVRARGNPVCGIR